MNTIQNSSKKYVQPCGRKDRGLSPDVFAFASHSFLFFACRVVFVVIAAAAGGVVVVVAVAAAIVALAVAAATVAVVVAVGVG